MSSFGINSKIIINDRNDIFKQKLNFSWKILKFLTYSFAKQITTNNKSNLEFLKLKYGNKAHYLPNPVMINKFKNKKEKNNFTSW